MHAQQPAVLWCLGLPQLSGVQCCLCLCFYGDTYACCPSDSYHILHEHHLLQYAMPFPRVRWRLSRPPCHAHSWYRMFSLLQRSQHHALNRQHANVFAQLCSPVILTPFTQALGSMLQCCEAVTLILSVTHVATPYFAGGDQHAVLPPSTFHRGMVQLSPW